MKTRNILQENMIRFNTKNLSPATRTKLIRESEKDSEDTWLTSGIRGGVIKYITNPDYPYSVNIEWNGKRITGITDDKATQIMIAQLIGGDAAAAGYNNERPMEPEAFVEFLGVGDMKEVAQKLAKAIGAQFKEETVTNASLAAAERKRQKDADYYRSTGHATGDWGPPGDGDYGMRKVDNNEDDYEEDEEDEKPTFGSKIKSFLGFKK